MPDSIEATVEVARPGKPPKIIRGLVAKWILYLADNVDFYSDARNKGEVTWSFSGKNNDVQQSVKLTPQP